MKFHVEIIEGALFKRSHILVSPWPMRVIVPEFVPELESYVYPDNVILQWYGDVERFPGHLQYVGYVHPYMYQTFKELVDDVQRHRRLTYMSPEWYEERERQKNNPPDMIDLGAYLKRFAQS